MPLADSVLVTEVVLEGTRDAVAAPETLTEGVPLSQKLPDSVTLGEEVGEALRHSVTEPDTEGVRLAVTLGEAVSVVEMEGEAVLLPVRHRVGLLLPVLVLLLLPQMLGLPLLHLLLLRVRDSVTLLQPVAVAVLLRHSVAVALSVVLMEPLPLLLPVAAGEREALAQAEPEALPPGLLLLLRQPVGVREGSGEWLLLLLPPVEVGVMGAVVGIALALPLRQAVGQEVEVREGLGLVLRERVTEALLQGEGVEVEDLQRLGVGV